MSDSPAAKRPKLMPETPALDLPSPDLPSPEPPSPDLPTLVNWVQSKLQAFGDVKLGTKFASLERKLTLPELQQLQSARSNASKACGQLSSKAADLICKLQMPGVSISSLHGPARSTLHQIRDQGISWERSMQKCQAALCQVGRKWTSSYSETRSSMVRLLQGFVHDTVNSRDMPAEFEQQREALKVLMMERGTEFVDCQFALFKSQLEAKLTAVAGVTTIL